ncbi:hypothetical protein [Cryobacterium sp. Y57]|uniref:hypothetical protein n=1 Tax=Cryobacterium sp. Y57 TaxID=2048287 RepID=UPI0013049B0E|nr:hypothetical protein [Cryobacterium sp. Y57]
MRTRGAVASRVDCNHTTTVVTRVEGNFSGRSVEQNYRFTLHTESGLIEALTISI